MLRYFLQEPIKMGSDAFSSKFSFFLLQFIFYVRYGNVIHASRHVCSLDSGFRGLFLGGLSARWRKRNGFNYGLLLKVIFISAVLFKSL